MNPKFLSVLCFQLNQVTNFFVLSISSYHFDKLFTSCNLECRVLHLGLLYVCSLLVLVVYSISYGLTSKEARWLGALSSVAVVILGNVLS